MRNSATLWLVMVCLISSGQAAARAQAVESGELGDEKAKAREAEADFLRLYRLDDGEVLKAILDPKTAIRVTYAKAYPASGVPRESADVSVYYRWRDGALAKDPFWMGGDNRLRGILSPIMGLQPHAAEGDAELLKARVDADFIVRDKAPAGEIVASLESSLRRDFKLPVKLTLAELERPCIVVRGRYKFTPATDQRAIEPGERDHIEVRAGEIGGCPNLDQVGAGGFSTLLSSLSDHTGHRFIDEAEAGPGAIIGWHITAYSNGVGVDDDRLEPILKNLAKDTGLTFERVNRRVRVLKVERTE
jgi:hypothetical protein